jgi:DNA-binding beta-propeller fold protein YncE
MLLSIVCIGMALLAGCAAGSGTGGDKSASVNEQAAIEATAIIQRAEATAIILQAQSKATALIEQASIPSAAPATATAMPHAIQATRVPTPFGVASSTVITLATPSAAATEDASLSQVELLSVNFAAEGNYIHVAFRAPPRVARQWGQGNVSVIDEATGIVYSGIPVQPLIGPLIGRPVHDGQIGYVMLVNDGLGIKLGSVVTVILGNFKQEHVIVK